MNGPYKHILFYFIFLVHVKNFIWISSMQSQVNERTRYQTNIVSYTRNAIIKLSHFAENETLLDNTKRYVIV